VRSAISANNGTDPKTQTASCDAGDRATGGGGTTSSADVYLYSSAPTGSPPTGWTASAGEDSGIPGTWSLTTYVVCADTTP
jgi:hypothetical protein